MLKFLYRELSALGVKEPQYHFVAFIMKAIVCVKVLEKGQETNIDAAYRTAWKQKNWRLNGRKAIFRLFFRPKTAYFAVRFSWIGTNGETAVPRPKSTCFLSDAKVRNKW